MWLFTIQFCHTTLYDRSLHRLSTDSYIILQIDVTQIYIYTPGKKFNAPILKTMHSTY